MSCGHLEVENRSFSVVREDLKYRTSTFLKYLMKEGRESISAPRIFEEYLNGFPEN